MKSFQRIILLCIIGTYMVIMAGAVVRGTGSGLGCPDWPRCFGQWIPPMDIHELPANYKDVYKIAGKTIADFDPFKTWTEYINRLLGVLLGFGIIALFIKSFGLKEQERNLPWFCGGLLFLILIQGGVGALVVSTHLKPFLITIHMFLAVLLLFGLLYLRKYCQDLQDISIVPQIDLKALRISKVLVAFAFLQILMGTQVRQQVDHLTRDTQTTTYQEVINHLGAMFYTHRSFSLIILACFLYLLTYLHRTRYNRGAFLLAFMAFLCVLANIFTGLSLNYFGFPANAQPPHLFFGVMAIGFLYSLYLNLKGTLLED
ncbi:MAG: COX15/CtaA family protein [Bdellovibrionales bacterium]|nr:COX15/CtaA family protein [Bdellovibrionales bacterium]